MGLRPGRMVTSTGKKVGKKFAERMPGLCCRGEGGELTAQGRRAGLRAAKVTADAGNGWTEASGSDVLHELCQVGFGRSALR